MIMIVTGTLSINDKHGMTMPTGSEIFPHKPSGHALGCQNVVQPLSTTESEQVFALVKT